MTEPISDQTGHVVRLSHGQWVIMTTEQYEDYKKAIEKARADPDFLDHPGEE